MRTFLRSSLVVADILGVSGIIFVQWNGEYDCVRVLCKGNELLLKWPDFCRVGSTSFILFYILALT